MGEALLSARARPRSNRRAHSRYGKEEMHVKVRSRKTIAVGLVAALAALALVVAGATAGTASKKATVDVCVLLPDTSSSVRWVQFDAPLLAAAFKKAGVKARVTNALNDEQKQIAQAQACLASG